MKFLLISLLLLPAPVFAQRAVEPVRLSLTLQEETADNREFDGHLRAELNKFRHVAITSRRADFEVTTVTTPVTARGEVIGYCAAVLIVDSRRRFRLSIETGATLPAMAKNLALYLDREFFKQKAGR